MRLLFLLLISDAVLPFLTALSHIAVKSRSYTRHLSFVTGTGSKTVPRGHDVDTDTNVDASDKKGATNGVNAADETKSTTVKNAMSPYFDPTAVVEDIASAAAKSHRGNTTKSTNSTSLSDEINSGNATNNDSAANATTILPPEAEQTESWTMAILSIFSFLALSLCTATAWERFSQRRNRRRDYQEIENLVV